MPDAFAAYCVEDSAQAQFVQGALRAIAKRCGVRCDSPFAVHERGGIGPAKKRRREYCRQILHPRHGTLPMPDLLVVVVDGDTVGGKARRREIDECFGDVPPPRVVIGTPEPHVERWLASEVALFEAVTGCALASDGDTPDSMTWKRRVAESLAAGPHATRVRVADVARDLGEALASRGTPSSDESLRKFLEELHSKFQQLA